MQPEALMIVEALVQYLLANPHACDTQDGIERWWLSGISAAPQDVGTALDWMVLHGYLQASTAADGQTRYRRNATDETLKTVLDGIRRKN
jgi:hypothetical protein